MLAITRVSDHSRRWGKGAVLKRRIFGRITIGVKSFLKPQRGIRKSRVQIASSLLCVKIKSETKLNALATRFMKCISNFISGTKFKNTEKQKKKQVKGIKNEELMREILNRSWMCKMNPKKDN